MISNSELDAAAAARDPDRAPVLLVEDDDGDALLVEELLREVDAPVIFQRARSLGQASAMVSEAACVLLDLGLPDSVGLQGLRQLLETSPEVAIVVLTGVAERAPRPSRRSGPARRTTWSRARSPGTCCTG